MPKVRISITKLKQTLYEVELPEDEIMRLISGDITGDEIIQHNDDAVILQSGESLDNEEIFTEDDVDFNAFFIQ